MIVNVEGSLLLTLCRKYNKISELYAEVAELVDAHGSGPCGSNPLRVQVPSSARWKIRYPRALPGGILFYVAQKRSVNPRVQISEHACVFLGRLGGVSLHLRRIEVIVDSFSFQKFSLGSEFRDAVAVDDHDPVCVVEG